MHTTIETLNRRIGGRLGDLIRSAEEALGGQRRLSPTQINETSYAITLIRLSEVFLGRESLKIGTGPSELPANYSQIIDRVCDEWAT